MWGSRYVTFFGYNYCFRMLSGYVTLEGSRADVY